MIWCIYCKPAQSSPDTLKPDSLIKPVDTVIYLTRFAHDRLLIELAEKDYLSDLVVDQQDSMRVLRFQRSKLESIIQLGTGRDHRLSPSPPLLLVREEEIWFRAYQSQLAENKRLEIQLKKTKPGPDTNKGLFWIGVGFALFSLTTIFLDAR